MRALCSQAMWICTEMTDFHKETVACETNHKSSVSAIAYNNPFLDLPALHVNGLLPPAKQNELVMISQEQAKFDFYLYKIDVL